MLIMTKALGTGILTTAFKGEMISEAELQPAVDAMCTLNRYGAECARGLRIHACTDITGFGMAGHLCEMAEGSNLTAMVYGARLPILPKVVEMARMGMIPGGMYRNRKHFGDRLDLSSVDEAIADIMLDPQTSGGLLFAVDEGDAQTLLRRLRDSGVTAAEIGVLSAFDGVYIRARQPGHES